MTHPCPFSSYAPLKESGNNYVPSLDIFQKSILPRYFSKLHSIYSILGQLNSLKSFYKVVGLAEQNEFLDFYEVN